MLPSNVQSIHHPHGLHDLTVLEDNRMAAQHLPRDLVPWQQWITRSNDEDTTHW